MSAARISSVPGRNVGANRPCRVEHRRDADRLETGHVTVADEAVRTAAKHDAYALAFGFLDLLRIGRDLLGRFERDDRHVEHPGAARGTRDVEGRGHRAARVVFRGGTERDRRRLLGAGRHGTQCRARGVERDVAAADDDHPFAERDPEALIDVEEVLDRAEHTVEIVARQIEIAGASGADGDEQRAVPVEQLGDRVRLADPGVGLDLDAELDDRLDLPGDERARQPVFRDAEHHHAAEPVLRLVDGDGMAGEAQVARGREPRGAAADHSDAWARCRRDVAVRRVPHGVGLEALDPEALGDEPLQRTDGDGGIDRSAPARALARCRADPTADRRERVRCAGDEVRLLESAFRDRGDVGAGVGVHRARRSARLVGPEPVGAGYGRGGHQITFRRCNHRSATAIANRTRKKSGVTIPTRLLRVVPCTFVRIAFAPKTSRPNPTRTMTTAVAIARSQLIEGGSCGSVSMVSSP